MKNALVIGGTGLLGYGVSIELYKQGWNVKVIGREELLDSSVFPSEIEYIKGDFYNEFFFEQSLKGIDKVFFFLSSTFPSTSHNSLEIEISKTLSGLDYLLRKMIKMNIPEIVFPSSGGTIYGNVKYGNAHETDNVKPITPYGVGKKMCEDILLFYSHMGVTSTVLRIGNVYGTPFIRKKNQGVIDIFIQKAIRNETATIWGDALNNVRDYIFIDDFSRAVAEISKYHSDEMEIYNLSTGIGTTLDSIIYMINKYSKNPLNVKYIKDEDTLSIERVVLDMSKFKAKTGWIPKYNIEEGIIETFNRKREIIS